MERWNREHVDRLLTWLSVFEAPGFQACRWEKSWKDAKGVLQMGYPVYSGPVEDFLSALGSAGSDLGAEWRPTDPAAFRDASLDQVQHYLLRIRREERFSEGTVEVAFRKGMVVAALRRLQDLRLEASP